MVVVVDSGTVLIKFVGVLHFNGGGGGGFT